MDKSDHPVFDRLLDAAIGSGRGVRELLRDRKNPTGTIQKILSRIRFGSKLLSYSYLVSLTLLLAAMEWYGERSWLLSFLLYLPPTGWLLPLLILTPLAVVFTPKVCWSQLGCLLLVLFLYMDFKWSRWPVVNGPSLTVLTNNIGESNKQSLTPFIQAENPDIIALQDALYRGPAYATAYPGRSVVEHAEFVLISKLPIQRSGLVPGLSWKGAPVAAWYEIEWLGQALLIYNVHLPSPRADLDLMRGLGFPVIVLSPAHTRYGQARRNYQDSWAARRQLERELLNVFQNEKRPFIAVGDFNTPDHGYAYHLFDGQLNDAAKKAGRGYGFTLPGTTRNPLSLFGPWLRIDYLFSSAALAPVYCRTEPSRKSQHRAVAARFILKPIE